MTDVERKGLSGSFTLELNADNGDQPPDLFLSRANIAPARAQFDRYRTDFDANPLPPTRRQEDNHRDTFSIAGNLRLGGAGFDEHDLLVPQTPLFDSPDIGDWLSPSSPQDAVIGPPFSDRQSVERAINHFLRQSRDSAGNGDNPFNANTAIDNVKQVFLDYAQGDLSQRIIDALQQELTRMRRHGELQDEAAEIKAPGDLLSSQERLQALQNGHHLLIKTKPELLTALSRALQAHLKPGETIDRVEDLAAHYTSGQRTQRLSQLLNEKLEHLADSKRLGKGLDNLEHWTEALPAARYITAYKNKHLPPAAEQSMQLVEAKVLIDLANVDAITRGDQAFVNPHGSAAADDPRLAKSVLLRRQLMELERSPIDGGTNFAPEEAFLQPEAAPGSKRPRGDGAIAVTLQEAYMQPALLDAQTWQSPSVAHTVQTYRRLAAELAHTSTALYGASAATLDDIPEPLLQALIATKDLSVASGEWRGAVAKFALNVVQDSAIGLATVSANVLGGASAIVSSRLLAHAVIESAQLDTSVSEVLGTRRDDVVQLVSTLLGGGAGAFLKTKGANEFIQEVSDFIIDTGSELTAKMLDYIRQVQRGDSWSQVFANVKGDVATAVLSKTLMQGALKGLGKFTTLLSDAGAVNPARVGDLGNNGAQPPMPTAQQLENIVNGEVPLPDYIGKLSGNEQAEQLTLELARGVADLRGRENYTPDQLIAWVNAQVNQYAKHLDPGTAKKLRRNAKAAILSLLNNTEKAPPPTITSLANPVGEPATSPTRFTNQTDVKVTSSNPTDIDNQKNPEIYAMARKGKKNTNESDFTRKLTSIYAGKEFKGIKFSSSDIKILEAVLTSPGLSLSEISRDKGFGEGRINQTFKKIGTMIDPKLGKIVASLPDYLPHYLSLMEKYHDVLDEYGIKSADRSYKGTSNKVIDFFVKLEKIDVAPDWGAADYHWSETPDKKLFIRATANYFKILDSAAYQALAPEEKTFLSEISNKILKENNKTGKEINLTQIVAILDNKDFEHLGKIAPKMGFEEPENFLAYLRAKEQFFVVKDSSIYSANPEKQDLMARIATKKLDISKLNDEEKDLLIQLGRKLSASKTLNESQALARGEQIYYEAIQKNAKDYSIHAPEWISESRFGIKGKIDQLTGHDIPLPGDEHLIKIVEPLYSQPDKNLEDIAASNDLSLPALKQHLVDIALSIDKKLAQTVKHNPETLRYYLALSREYIDKRNQAGKPVHIEIFNNPVIDFLYDKRVNNIKLPWTPGNFTVELYGDKSSFHIIGPNYLTWENILDADTQSPLNEADFDLLNRLLLAPTRDEIKAQESNGFAKLMQPLGIESLPELVQYWNNAQLLNNAYLPLYSKLQLSGWDKPKVVNELTQIHINSLRENSRPMTDSQRALAAEIARDRLGEDAADFEEGQLVAAGLTQIEAIFAMLGQKPRVAKDLTPAPLPNTRADATARTAKILRGTTDVDSSPISNLELNAQEQQQLKEYFPGTDRVSDSVRKYLYVLKENPYLSNKQLQLSEKDERTLTDLGNTYFPEAGLQGVKNHILVQQALDDGRLGPIISSGPSPDAAENERQLLALLKNPNDTRASQAFLSAIGNKDPVLGRLRLIANLADQPELTKQFTFEAIDIKALIETKVAKDIDWTSPRYRELKSQVDAFAKNLDALPPRRQHLIMAPIEYDPIQLLEAGLSWQSLENEIRLLNKEDIYDPYTLIAKFDEFEEQARASAPQASTGVGSMAALGSVSYPDMHKGLNALGFKVRRHGKGDHVIYGNDDGTVTFPVPAHTEVKPGTVQGILKLIGVDAATFKRAMGK